MSRWALRSPLEAGDVLGGRFRVDSLLGRGTVGAVHEATCLSSGERVAIKCLLGPASAAHGARLLREARAAGLIASPHAIKISEVGALLGGGPFLVMELLRGYDLRAHLAAARPSPTEAARLLSQACEALCEAHAKGVVHRDLKPENLFVLPHGGGSFHLKVIDFGASGLAGERPEPRLVPGNDEYLAPELRLAPEGADPLGDVWSLGAIFFEMLTGGAPFEASTRSGRLARALSEPPALPRGLILPPALADLLARCLDREPARRPSAGELLSGLR